MFKAAPRHHFGQTKTATFLIHCEAIKQSRAAGAHQIVLAATAAWVSGIPRSIVPTAPVKMPELSRASRFARPVAAGVVHAIRVGSAIGLRAGQHVVHVRSVATPVKHGPFFCERGKFHEIISKTRKFRRVPVQIGKVVGNFLSLGVVPGAIPDSIARIHARLAVCGVGAHIGVPGFTAAANGRGKCLANSVCSRETAEIRSMAGTCTGNKETHGLRRSLCGLLCERNVSAYHGQQHCSNDGLYLPHRDLLQVNVITSH